MSNVVMRSCGYLLFKSADNALWEEKRKGKREKQSRKDTEKQSGTWQRIIMQQPLIAVNFIDTAAGDAQQFSLGGYDALYGSLIKEMALRGERLSPVFQPLSPHPNTRSLPPSFIRSVQNKIASLQPQTGSLLCP